MKTKLLRKLHKRFHWYKQDGYNCWSFDDKKTGTSHYAFVLETYYINDMLLYSMLDRMNRLEWYKRLRDRLEAKEKIRRKMVGS